MTSFDRDLARSSAETLREKRILLSSLDVPAGRGWHPLRERVTDCLCTKPDTIGEVIGKPQPATNDNRAGQAAGAAGGESVAQRLSRLFKR